MSKKEECVRVVVRCRPMSSKEKADNRQKVVEMDKTRGQARARHWLFHFSAARRRRLLS